ncbi:MAG: uL15 family ribosomal protein [Patescibacteria group bacterium]|nr:uL15 family ribosomal protein [Patescibacteria group bacterium]
MQIHQLKAKHKNKKGKRIGRGGKRGTHSGRGIKGQQTRAGRKKVPDIRQLIKKYPKLRGYKFKIRREKPEIVNIKTLQKYFKEKEIVSPKTLLDKKLISRIKGRLPKVKILGQGEIKNKLIIRDCIVSKSAKEKIEKTGGQIK